MSKDNNKKLKYMSHVLTIFIQRCIKLGTSELSALHYSTAVTLTGVKKKLNIISNPSTKQNPDKCTKERTENTKEMDRQIVINKE